MDNQPTTQDILEAINEFSSRVDERFEKIDERFEKIENTMVTKIDLADRLNEKLSELHADLVTLTRKEDKKLGTTVELLAEKCVFTKDEANNILAMEPFPKISV